MIPPPLFFKGANCFNLACVLRIYHVPGPEPKEESINLQPLLFLSPLQPYSFLPHHHSFFLPEDLMFQQEGSVDRKHCQLPCVFDDAPCCCFTIPSSVQHIEMRSGSGLGPELGKARSPACFSCPSASVSHAAFYGPRERRCVCEWGRAPF